MSQVDPYPQKIENKEFSALAYGFGAYFTYKEFRKIANEYISDILEYKFVAEYGRPTIKIKFKNHVSLVRTCRKLHGSKHTDRNGDVFTLSFVRRSKLTVFASKEVANHARIIIRNLPFKFEKERFRKLVEKEGPISDFRLVIGPDNKGLAINKGCCFVQYYNPVDASRAITRLNGTVFGKRMMVVDWAIPKTEYTKEPQNQVIESTGKVEELYGYSKDRKRSKQSQLQNNSKLDSNIDETFSGESNDDTQTHPVCKRTKNGEKSVDSSVERGQNGNEAHKSHRNQVDHDRTIFVSKIPSGVDKKDLEEAFGVFGKINYCVLVMDKVIKMPNGSAFIKFENPESVKSVYQCASTSGISVSDSFVRVRPALTRDELENISKCDISQKPNNITPATDKETRRRQKIKRPLKDDNNSNFEVSKTRICLRNLPVTLDEPMIREYITEKLKILPSKIKVRIVRDKFRNEPVAVRKEKIRKRSLGYGFINCANTKLAKSVIKLLDGQPLKNVMKDDKLENNIIAQYSIENKDKIKS